MLTFLKVEDCGPAASEESPDIYQDSVLEGLKSLIGRSDDQERELAQLSTVWQFYSTAPRSSGRNSPANASKWAPNEIGR